MLIQLNLISFHVESEGQTYNISTKLKDFIPLVTLSVWPDPNVLEMRMVGNAMTQQKKSRIFTVSDKVKS